MSSELTVAKVLVILTAATASIITAIDLESAVAYGVYSDSLKNLCQDEKRIYIIV